MLSILAIPSKVLTYAIPIIYALLGFVFIPMICMWIVSILGNRMQKTFGNAFGARTQAVLGGLGAVLHEFYNIVVAVIGGHSLRQVHMHSLYDIQHKIKIGDVSHFWANHGVWNAITTYLRGTLPYYLMLTTVFGIQRMLGGTPIPNNIETMSLKSYIHLTTWVRFIFHTLSNNLSSSITGFLFFIIIAILISTDGFHISHLELSDAGSGMFIWGVLVIIITALCKLFNLIDPKYYSLAFININVWLMFKVMWFMLVAWAIMLCFSLINHTADATSKMSNAIGNHRHKKQVNKVPKSHKLRGALYNFTHKSRQPNQNIKDTPNQQPIRTGVKHRYVTHPTPNFNPNQQSRRPSQNINPQPNNYQKQHQPQQNPLNKTPYKPNLHRNTPMPNIPHNPNNTQHNKGNGINPNPDSNNPNPDPNHSPLQSNQPNISNNPQNPQGSYQPQGQQQPNQNPQGNPYQAQQPLQSNQPNINNNPQNPQGSYQPQGQQQPNQNPQGNPYQTQQPQQNNRKQPIPNQQNQPQTNNQNEPNQNQNQNNNNNNDHGRNNQANPQPNPYQTPPTSNNIPNGQNNNNNNMNPNPNPSPNPNNINSQPQNQNQGSPNSNIGQVPTGPNNMNQNLNPNMNPYMNNGTANAGNIPNNNGMNNAEQNQLQPNMQQQPPQPHNNSKFSGAAVKGMFNGAKKNTGKFFKGLANKL